MNPTLIFDMDGVLINTTQSYNLVLLKIYEHFTKKTVTPEEVKEIKMLGGYNNDWDLLNYLFKREGFQVPYSDLIVEHKKIYCNENYEGYINNETMILNREYIENLSKNYNLTIFTGRIRHEALYTLDRFGIKNYFTKIVTFNEVGENHQKPDPLGVELIKQEVNSKRIYYMGDTVDDTAAAKAAGVLGIGVLPPQDKSEKLRNKMMEFGAYAVINDTNDLAEFLKKDLTLA